MKFATVISSTMWAAAVLALVIEFGVKIAPFCKINSGTALCNASEYPVLFWGAIGLLMFMPPLLINNHFQRKL